MKKQDREMVWFKYEKRCAYCGDDILYKDLQVDHIVPSVNGGKDEMGNYNPSCRSCNFYKGSKHIDTFRRELGRLIVRVKAKFVVRLAIKYGLISFKDFDGTFYFERFPED